MSDLEKMCNGYIEELESHLEQGDLTSASEVLELIDEALEANKTQCTVTFYKH